MNLSSLNNRFITKITRDALTGALLFHDARKQVMFVVRPEDIRDPSYTVFNDDIVKVTTRD